MAGQEDTCWRCGVSWVDREERDEEPGGRSGVALLDLEDAAEMLAAAPGARHAAISGRA
jgi:hypothetical protein